MTSLELEVAPEHREIYALLLSRQGVFPLDESGRQMIRASGGSAFWHSEHDTWDKYILAGEDGFAVGFCWETPEPGGPGFLVYVSLELFSSWRTWPGHSQWGTCRCSVDAPCQPGEMGWNFDGCMVKAYAHDMRKGDPFPPGELFYRPFRPDSKYGAWQVDDGFHRTSAAALLGYTHFPMYVFPDYKRKD